MPLREATKAAGTKAAGTEAACVGLQRQHALQQA